MKSQNTKKENKTFFASGRSFFGEIGFAFKSVFIGIFVTGEVWK